MSGRNGRAPGFTLVELVVVVVLAAILGAFIIPRLSLKKVEEKGYAEQVLAAIRYAQKLAVASGCGVQVTLGAGGYALDYTGAPPPCVAGAVANPASGQAFAGAPPAGTSISAVSFSYDPFGRASVGQTLSVGAYAIQVVGETGFAHVP